MYYYIGFAFRVYVFYFFNSIIYLLKLLSIICYKVHRLGANLIIGMSVYMNSLSDKIVGVNVLP